MEYVFTVKVRSDGAEDAVSKKMDAALTSIEDVDDVEWSLQEARSETWVEASQPMDSPECGSSDVAIHPAGSPSFECRECGHVLG